MRLIGVPTLFALVQRGDPLLRGAVLALHAELVAARWRCIEDAQAAYPNAKYEAHRLVVSLDDLHCAVLAINYEMGIAVFEFAGSRMDSPTSRPNMNSERDSLGNP